MSRKSVHITSRRVLRSHTQVQMDTNQDVSQGAGSVVDENDHIDQLSDQLDQNQFGHEDISQQGQNVNSILPQANHPGSQNQNEISESQRRWEIEREDKLKDKEREEQIRREESPGR